MVRLVTCAALMFLLGSAASCLAGPADDAQWPCAQAKTGPVSAAAVWTGPDIAKAGNWEDDQDAAELAHKLASRRTPLTDADGLIAAFAAKAGADKSARLTHVFAGVLDIINTERNRVISGIVRYARGQNRLAEKIRDEADKIGDQQEAKNLTAVETLKDAQSSLAWDKRIFEARSQSLTYVCETPMLLENRLFEIARKIQQRL
ncbi:hypothetical protein K9U39_01265 [Rhodoblastus acidophilus]|uniref:Secreted protein n=1 Tax=Candidatus Rhodoblastus alkanivorans TaxID=2954117 RepID=A0ABS9Z4H8_9HYPH|nr:hypothetical protein [Candidatus Rhodoblastus alkanivorans]MCI4680198.1 hypothetical protein [Candidatus Rhodoblastus alkanivorans]MCI4682280.1 hypothetical protein [Candidatus Rhodoblastus alkanivorans]MDI4639582.1 hypothetical protein [Rhodoblastus acidophilus]